MFNVAQIGLARVVYCVATRSEEVLTDSITYNTWMKHRDEDITISSSVRVWSDGYRRR